MKISFDMQAFQSANRIGGIGKYNHDFLRTLFRLYPENQYTLLYNRTKNLDIPFEVGNPPECCSKTIQYLPGNDLNFLNRFLSLLTYKLDAADITHILSPFESQKHTVIPNKFLPKNTVITLYDFIPHLYQNLYLSQKLDRQQYYERLKILNACDLILSISDATRLDAVNLFQVPPEKIINIGIAPSNDYYKEMNPESLASVRQKYDIQGNFVLTVSNLDHRKNLPTLLKSFFAVPKNIKKEFSLVLVTNSSPYHMEHNDEVKMYFKQRETFNLKILYSVPNEDLRALYSECSLFVFASLYEGGGLPVIEAMKCGAPVAASNTSSIPEFVGRNDNLFDPKSSDSICSMIEKILTDEQYRLELQNYGLEHSKQITWDAVVHKVVEAYHCLSIKS